MDYPELVLQINGRLCGVQGRETIEVVDPATEAVLGLLPKATPADVEEALQAAGAAFHVWRKTPALDRAKVL
ncbi:MAG TPA: aldehyde dehydrogenase family protein, partial [Bordetella sp.]